VEEKDHIVFLHSVEEGPANRSYGLQVAQLAGVPGPVIRAARRRLAELEEHGMTPAPQRDLFRSPGGEADEPLATALHPALELLAALEPDTVTPKEALDALYRLKDLAGRSSRDDPK
jgi:DNA mismatch repair protein MutS